jgi:RNA polymerase sigma factor (sigma-70 family)
MTGSRTVISIRDTPGTSPYWWSGIIVTCSFMPSPWLRKNKRYDLNDNELARIDADIALWQTQRVHEDNSLFDALECCLDRLPGTLRSVIDSFYYEGRSGEEVADVLQLAPAAVRKRLQRARTLLKQCLDLKSGQPLSLPES